MSRDPIQPTRDLFPGTDSRNSRNMHDAVNHPSHYVSGNAICMQCNAPIECIDITRHMNFNLGNAIKYIWRADYKGNKLEDLKKAVWYINDEIKKIQA
jgi:hypothetical protein